MHFQFQLSVLLQVYFPGTINNVSALKGARFLYDVHCRCIYRCTAHVHFISVVFPPKMYHVSELADAV